VDVDTIPAGQDFREVIDYSLDKCDVAIIVIGEKWLAVEEDSGERRIDNPADYVRLEVETVLSKNIPVIPLLVGGAKVPKPSDLPAAVADLAYKHAIIVRPGRDFERDIDALISDILRTSQFQTTLKKQKANDSAKPHASPTGVSDEKPSSTRSICPPTQDTSALSAQVRQSHSLPRNRRLGSESLCVGYYFVTSVLLVFCAYFVFAAAIIIYW